MTVNNAESCVTQDVCNSEFQMPADSAHVLPLSSRPPPDTYFETRTLAYWDDGTAEAEYCG
jgi:hypothetical protein